MKLKYRIIFFLIGLAGIGIMIWQSDVSSVDWDFLLTTETLLFFLAMFGLWLVIYSIHTICYYITLGKEWKKVPFFSLLKICISGFALNNVTPAGLVGGEPYRIMALKKYCSTEKASSATLTFSLFYIIGHVTIWLTGAIVFFVSGYPIDSMLGIILIVTAVVTTGILVAFFLSKRRGFVRPFMSLLAKIPLLKKPMLKIYDKNEKSYLEIDDNIKAFRNTRISFWTVFTLQYLSRILECVEYYLIFDFIGQSLNVFDGIILLTSASLIGNLMFLIPMQAGTREGGLVMALGILAIDTATGIIGALIYRIRDFVCIIIGILLIMFDKRKIIGKSSPAENVELNAEQVGESVEQPDTDSQPEEN